MIYIACKKIPDGTTAVGLYEKALSLYPESQANAQFIGELYQRCDKSAKESLFALVLLWQTLKASQAGLMPTLRRHESGKPYFEGSEWQFSISHSCGTVAVALSDEGAVGIDVENADISDQKAKKLAKRYFDKAEQERTESNSSLFYELWRKKEAVAKYFGIPLGELVSISKKYPAKYAELLAKVSVQTLDTPCAAVALCTSANTATASLLTDI